MLGLRPAAPQEVRSQSGGGESSGPGVPPHPHEELGPDGPMGEPPGRRVPSNQQPLRRRRGRAAPPPQGMDIRQMLRQRAQGPPSSPPRPAHESGEGVSSEPEPPLAGHTRGLANPGRDAPRPSLLGTEAGEVPRGARDAARGVPPVPQGPEGWGFFPQPPPVLQTRSPRLGPRVPMGCPCWTCLGLLCPGSLIRPHLFRAAVPCSGSQTAV